MKARALIPFAGCLLFMLVNTATGLQCQQCATKEQSGQNLTVSSSCADPFCTYKFAKDCPPGTDRCVKMEKDGGIIRTCQNFTLQIESNRTNELNKDAGCLLIDETKVCWCNTNKCNSADKMGISLVAVMSTVLLSCLFK